MYECVYEITRLCFCLLEKSVRTDYELFGKDLEPVSYTHLDVYKRQFRHIAGNTTALNNDPQSTEQLNVLMLSLIHIFYI